MSSSPINYTFKVRQDSFSVQVSCDQDPKFWFRLEIEEGQDQITDFFLGAFDSALGGDILAMCYAEIGRVPQDQLVFTDILSSQPSNANAVNAARAKFEEYAKGMLAHYQRSLGSSRISPRRDKFDLIMEAQL
jgi:hypothetical protein